MAAVRRATVSDVLGVVLIGAAGYGVYNEYKKTVTASSTISSIYQRQTAGGANNNNPGAPAKPQVVVKESAHEFLSKLAVKGDEIAAKTVDVVESSRAAHAPASLPMPAVPSVLPEEEFRFDVSKEGLAGTIQSMLEAKRTYETNYLEECRRTRRYPPDFAQQCREMRREKEELKRLLKGLTGKDPDKRWWWPF